LELGKFRMNFVIDLFNCVKAQRGILLNITGLLTSIFPLSVVVCTVRDAITSLSYDFQSGFVGRAMNISWRAQNLTIRLRYVGKTIIA